jgi:hypothetical protein
VICFSGQPEKQLDPKKPTVLARSSWGLEPARAVIASKAATVRVSTLFALSQEPIDGA